MLELHVIFTGEVQGVGFRTTAKRLADTLQLTGYVRNLPNGSVELVAQGSKEMLEQLLATLHLKFRVHEAMEKYVKPSQSYPSFQVTL